MRYNKNKYRLPVNVNGQESTDIRHTCPTYSQHIIQDNQHRVRQLVLVMHSESEVIY